MYDELASRFLSEAANHDILSREKEYRLLCDYHTTGSQKTRNYLVEMNQKLVISIALKWIGQGIHLSDLIQEGNLGLMHAIDKYDPEYKRHGRPMRLSTYATNWIKQYIMRHISQSSRTIRVPVYTYDRFKRYWKVRNRLHQELFREPTDEEMATELKMKVEAIRELRASMRETVSLDKGIENDNMEWDQSSMHRMVSDDGPGPGEAAEEALLSEEVAALVESLRDPRERRIIEMRFGLRDGVPMTLQEVADCYGLTRERIRQIEKDALTRLRHPRRQRRMREWV